MAYPRFIRNFNVFIDGVSYFGRAVEAKLPDVKVATSAHRGAGMDGPIGTLRGPGAQGAAIVVSLPGRRSLDTAGGFAQRDPRVVSAAINNRPGGAELTLRFRTPAPPFVARARGQTLEVILGPTPGAAPVRTARR